MVVGFFRYLIGHGLPVTIVFVFVSLLLAAEIGYRVGRHAVAAHLAHSTDVSATSTLTAGMVGLLAFTLGLSISFAQTRFEARRDLVLVEANAIGTAWLRAKLIDDADGGAIATAIENYARVRLAFTTAASESAVPALVARTNAVQSEIWRHTQLLVRRTPTPITAALVSALNDMFDAAAAQQFAYLSRVPIDILLMLYFGALLTIGALGYQFGLIGKRQVVLTSLLLVMWSGGMLFIIDLNQPRMGRNQADPAPLVWTIQGFTSASTPR